MDKYDKEKMKFIEDQVKILASQYDKLDIFNNLMYHGKYKNYNKSSYQLLDYIMPYDDQGINMIYDLTQDEVYKVIKEISIYIVKEIICIYLKDINDIQRVMILLL